MDTTLLRGRRKGQPNYPREFKRDLAQRACDPANSVSSLAREHGLNANMLFKWRREYRRGLLGNEPAALVPVTVAPLPVNESAFAAAAAGFVEIRIQDAVVRIEGAVEDRLLAMVILALRA